MKRIEVAPLVVLVLAACGGSSTKQPPESPLASTRQTVVVRRDARAPAPPPESAPPLPADATFDLATLVASREVQAVMPAKAAVRVNVAALRRHRRASLLRDTVTVGLGTDLFDEIEWAAWVGSDLVDMSQGFFVLQTIDAIDVSDRIARFAKGTPVKDVKTDAAFASFRAQPPRERELAAAHASGAALPSLGPELANAFDRMDAWVDDAGDGAADVHVRLRSAEPARVAKDAELLAAFVEKQNRSMVKMITRNILGGAKVSVAGDRDVALDLRATDEQLKRLIELVRGQVSPAAPANP